MISIKDAKLLHAWRYLYRTYKDNGSVPKYISEAIDIIRDKFLEKELTPCS